MFKGKTLLITDITISFCNAVYIFFRTNDFTFLHVNSDAT